MSETIKHKIEALSKEIEEHNYNYYVLSHPTISDFEFDKVLEDIYLPILLLKGSAGKLLKSLKQ